MTTTDHAIAELIRANLTAVEIRTLTGVGYSRIAQVRREHQLPTARPDRPSRTVDEALALYAEPHGDGHVRWNGPMRGRAPVFEAQGRRYSAREVMFRRHHGRAQLGNICTACTVPGCIAGAHLADRIARTPMPTNTNAAITLLIEIGASDWQIVTHLDTTAAAITRIRQTLNSTPGRTR